jgi:predicted nucleotidyltransferase
MANLQSKFLIFHDAIKTDFEDNQELREKRDLIVDDLRNGLRKLAIWPTPTFKHFDQGSYALKTGVKPLSGQDYDIDVGIIFNFSKTFRQPVQVKEWVCEILKARRKTTIKKPCVRVQYHQNGLESFHVDLAIYSLDRSYYGEEIHHIAKGLINSIEEYKFWEISEPFKLKKLLEEKFSNSFERKQFRRIIKYLKRWKDYNFGTMAGRPTGIALTACCYKLFVPQTDPVFNDPNRYFEYNDLKALQNVVTGIINMFAGQNKIRVDLPVQPHNDLFKKMTDLQMEFMKKKLIILHEALSSAKDFPLGACAKLREVFGSDFPQF